jgi:hypothetical protein
VRVFYDSDWRQAGSTRAEVPLTKAMEPIPAFRLQGPESQISCRTPLEGSTLVLHGVLVRLAHLAYLTGVPLVRAQFPGLLACVNLP